MNWQKEYLMVETRGKGMYLITKEVQDLITGWQVEEGLCVLFVPHTSASLVLSENYDRDSRLDVEQFLERLVPENQPWHQHTLEGGDDSPSHMRTVITSSSLTIPIDHWKLSLGTWQGIFLFEHRIGPMQRKILVRSLRIT